MAGYKRVCSFLPPTTHTHKEGLGAQKGGRGKPLGGAQGDMF